MNISSVESASSTCHLSSGTGGGGGGGGSSSGGGTLIHSSLSSSSYSSSSILITPIDTLTTTTSSSSAASSLPPSSSSTSSTSPLLQSNSNSLTTSGKDWFTYVYKIDNIEDIIRSYEVQQNFIQSPTFQFKNHFLNTTKQNSNWRLIFYPNGAGADCKNFLSIFLKYLSDEPVKIQMMFSIVNNNNEDVYVKYTVNKFNKSNDWGFKQLIHKNAILFQQDKFLKSGALSIRVKMRLEEHKNEYIKKLNDNLHYCKILSENFAQYYYQNSSTSNNNTNSNNLNNNNQLMNHNTNTTTTTQSTSATATTTPPIPDDSIIDNNNNSYENSGVAGGGNTSCSYYDILLIVKNSIVNTEPVNDSSSPVVAATTTSNKRRKSSDLAYPASKRLHTSNTSTSSSTTSSQTSENLLIENNINDDDYYSTIMDTTTSSNTSNCVYNNNRATTVTTTTTTTSSSSSSPSSISLTDCNYSSNIKKRQPATTTTPPTTTTNATIVQCHYCNLNKSDTEVATTTEETSSSALASSSGDCNSNGLLNSSNNMNKLNNSQCMNGDVAGGDSCCMNGGGDIKCGDSLHSNAAKSATGSIATVTPVTITEIYEFKAHKCILAARSPVFKAMFNYRLKENLTNKVIIEDCKPEVVKAMLKYIYTAYLPDDINQIAIDLFIAAEKYYIESLKLKVREYLVENLNSDNVIQAYILSELYNDSMLRKQSLKYITENIDEVTQNSDWDEYLKIYPQFFTNAIKRLCKKNF